jgi:hypothetical protein
MALDDVVFAWKYAGSWKWFLRNENLVFKILAIKEGLL